MPPGSIPPSQAAPAALYYGPSAVYYPGGLPYTYAPAPVLIPPIACAGWGNGYWYANRFWPYRPGCAFYGGRYYGGYQRNYWRGGNGSWQGYHGRCWCR